jgi:FeS assembly SUF system regulator
MLRISKLADYGTGIMTTLAKEPCNLLSANEISQRVHIALPTVSKVLKKLSVGASLVASVRGVDGGYRLAREAETITLADIITAVDGHPALTECNIIARTCAQDATCAIRDNWRIINKIILSVLESLTLADMTQPLQLNALVGRKLSLELTNVK